MEEDFSRILLIYCTCRQNELELKSRSASKSSRIITLKIFGKGRVGYNRTTISRDFGPPVARGRARRCRFTRSAIHSPNSLVSYASSSKDHTLVKLHVIRFGMPVHHVAPQVQLRYEIEAQLAHLRDGPIVVQKSSTLNKQRGDLACID